MLPDLIVAAFGVGMQAQTSSQPPPPAPPLVHGYVYFDANSATPVRRYQTDPIEYLGPKVPADQFVYVRGQTDTVGSEEFNDALSRRRAIAVADLLTLEGVNPERITIVSCGERLLNRPTADETSEPLNRFALFEWSAQPSRTMPLCQDEPYRR